MYVLEPFIEEIRRYKREYETVNNNITLYADITLFSSHKQFSVNVNCWNDVPRYEHFKIRSMCYNPRDSEEAGRIKQINRNSRKLRDLKFRKYRFPLLKNMFKEKHYDLPYYFENWRSPIQMKTFSPYSMSFTLSEQKCKCTKEPNLRGWCEDIWGWDRIHPVENACTTNCCFYLSINNTRTILFGSEQRNVLLNSNNSYHTVAIRGNKILNGGKFYWEIISPNDFYGTSNQFGICTEEASLYDSNYTVLIGKDIHGWALNYTGFIHHNGQEQLYSPNINTMKKMDGCFSCETYTYNTIGILFDGIEGTLTYYLNGKSMGIAFTNLHKVTAKLFPVVSSTTIQTMLIMGIQKREFHSLKDRCQITITSNLSEKSQINQLSLPSSFKESLIVENRVGNIFKETQYLHPDSNLSNSIKFMLNKCKACLNSKQHCKHKYIFIFNNIMTIDYTYAADDSKNYIKLHPYLTNHVENQH